MLSSRANNAAGPKVPRRGWLWGLILVPLLVVSGAALYYVFRPTDFAVMHRYLAEQYPWIPQPARAPSTMTQVTRQPQTQVRTGGRANCSATIEEFVNPLVKKIADPGHGLHVMECALLMDRPDIAIAEARRLSFSSPKDRDLALALQAMALLRHGQLARVESDSRAACPRWEPKGTCLVKLELLLNRELWSAATAGVQALLPQVGALPNSVRPLLAAWAGALHSGQGRYSEARAQWLGGLRASPSSLGAKVILENWAIAASRQAPADLPTILQEARRVLQQEESRVWFLVQFLVRIAESGGKAALTEFFSSSATHTPYLNYIPLLDILGISAVRNGISEQMLPYLRLVESRMSEVGADSLLLNEPRKWRLRVAVGQERQAELLPLLEEISRSGGASAFSMHFRGIALLGLNAGADYDRSAAEAFLNAVKTQWSFDAAYGAAFALLRIKQPEPALAQIAEMRRRAREPTEKLWTNVLTIEYLAQTGKTAAAKQHLDKLIQASSRQGVPLALLDLKRRLAMYAGTDPERRAAIDSYDRARAQLGLWGTNIDRSSPLGPLALLVRR